MAATRPHSPEQFLLRMFFSITVPTLVPGQATDRLVLRQPETLLPRGEVRPR